MNSSAAEQHGGGEQPDTGMGAGAASPSPVAAPAEDQPSGGVRIRRDGPVAELVLDRPEAMNAVSTELARRIGEACASLASDAGVSVVVLTSSHERAFCVGADLKERNALSDAELRQQRPYARAAYQGVLQLPMPTVAAVHGWALGGGLELALSCDLIVADETAQVGLPEVSVGVIPGGGGTQLLPRRVGIARAAELIYSARRVGADEAYRIGLVDQVVAPGTDCTEALALAGRIAGNSPVGLRAAKEALRGGWGADLESGLEAEDAAWHTVAFSADRAEGVAAFREKRPPRWATGR